MAFLFLLKACLLSNLQHVQDLLLLLLQAHLVLGNSQNTGDFTHNPHTYGSKGPFDIQLTS